ncbi:hypothetical protein OOK41_25330 [Micromonospora sp. NBC_01655]|uniref:hypothetical protein n=1 Tax=Micromonospora sp. NBC_01655 TaxID=2975983 RepID=UPI00224F08DD|nr:hypothetical protein [Micromonospora sp. NBC_01655]MCX4473589.1 hypothetical protein [Micromonospora sp. NBC_01655]
MVAAALALCLLGVCGAAVVGVSIFKSRSGPQGQSAARSSPWPIATTGALPQVEPTDSPPQVAPTTEAAPPPPPAKIGQCVVVSEAGSFQGIGNCNGTRGTYRVVSMDYSQGECADPDSAYITEAGYRLCLELHLVRYYCYKFPKGSGWVVGATKCKAKGTVHIIDIVPGASNGNRCTRDRKWNRWYRFTNPTVVYCVMKY